MRVLAILLLGVLVSVGCAQRNAKNLTSEQPVGVGGEEAKFGNYSREEVESLHALLAKVSFPVPEDTVARMLPRPAEPLSVQFVDWVPDQEKKGRIGGNVVEYWLNNEYVLKVATAYYVQGEKQFSLEEWAVILTRAEWANYHRRVY